MGVTLTDYRKTVEDEILSIVTNWRQVKKDLLYKFLHCEGCRIEGIDYKIEQALRAEVKEQNNIIG